MSRALYGSFQNRIMENRQFVEEIKVGDGVTEYMYSDRHPYEVVEVSDQKHVKIRRLDHRPAGEPMSNDWELIRNDEHPCITLVKRGKYWYHAVTATLKDLDDKSLEGQLWLAHNGFDEEKIRKNGSQTKYHRMNISFGHAEYYYDYSF